MAQRLSELAKAVKVPSTRLTRLNANKAALRQDKKKMRLSVRR